MLKYTQEEILKDVPEFDIPGVKAEMYEDCGEATFFRVITQIDLDGYHAYLSKVEQAGFQLQERHIIANGHVHTAIYRKDERILTATFYPTMTKIWFAISKAIFDKPWSDAELLARIPLWMNGAPVEKNLEHYGAGNYGFTREHTTKDDYEAYLKKLEQSGFVKYADNGAGLNGTVFEAVYEKENLVVHVTHLVPVGRTQISVCQNQPLSEHLLPISAEQDAYKAGEKTSLHMLELKNFGNSFVIRLKNGHFLINDGGFEWDAWHLLGYLEQLTTEGEKPVIDAWVISHGHRDHCGVLRGVVQHPEYAERIWVEGIYFSEPSDKVIALDVAARSDVAYLHDAAKLLRTTKSEETPIYRPSTGERYYFCDVTLDILLAQEQLPYVDYSGDLNDSSTWCLFTIEGQKCLLGGDGCEGGMDLILRLYDKEFLTLDVFSVLHHGWNTRDDFTDYCTFKTVLHTRKGGYLPQRLKQNQYLNEHCEEWLEWEDGTKILEFPYVKGNAKTLPKVVWPE